MEKKNLKNQINSQYLVALLQRCLLHKVLLDRQISSNCRSRTKCMQFEPLCLLYSLNHEVLVHIEEIKLKFHIKSLQMTLAANFRTSFTLYLFSSFFSSFVTIAIFFFFNFQYLIQYIFMNFLLILLLSYFFY